jgi:hypothetical protein
MIETINYEYWNDLMVDGLLEGKRAKDYYDALNIAECIWDNVLEVVKKQFPNVKTEHIDTTLELKGNYADKAKTELENILSGLDFTKAFPFELPR